MQKKARTDYPIHDLLASRWSPRAFASRPVSTEALRSLLEAARWAPSSYNEQPWSFLVARREDAEEFETLLACVGEKNRTWARDAGVLMLAVTHSDFERNGKPNRHARHDLGQALAHLSVQATELGLVVHQMAGILPDEARRRYGIPDGFEVLTGVAIGHAGDPARLPEGFRDAESAPRQRKPQSEFVFRGAWGRSAGWSAPDT